MRPFLAPVGISPEMSSVLGICPGASNDLWDGPLCFAEPIIGEGMVQVNEVCLPKHILFGHVQLLLLSRPPVVFSLRPQHLDLGPVPAPAQNLSLFPRQVE